MKILIGCEMSGRVREAFRAKGHNAWSCDILPTADKSPYHIQGDVLEQLDKNWDMGIFFPPCTHLCVSGGRWFFKKKKEQEAAIQFVRKIMESPIPRIAIENPIGVLSSRLRKPTQIIQPWQHGHGETKATCLWLKGLPKLKPSNVVAGREHNINKLGPSPDRSMIRSLTYPGIAQAMADQWPDKYVVADIRGFLK